MVELRVWTEALEDGERACLVEEARGGSVWPGLRAKLVGDGGGAERNWGGLEAEGRSGLGEKEEEALRF